MWWVSWVSIKSSSPTTRILESLESYAPRDMFKDVLSSIVSKSKNLKTTQIPISGKAENTMWYIHPVECYSLVKVNKFQLFAITWLYVKNIMSTKIKSKLRRMYMFHLLYL